MKLNPFKKEKKPEGPPGYGGPPEPMAAGPGPPASGPPAPESDSAGPGRPSRKIIPTDEVKALSSRGVPEPDIIRTLRREGYSTSDIDQAMKEALRSRVSGEAYGPPEGNPPGNEQIPGDLGYPLSSGGEGADLPPPPEYYSPRRADPDMPESPVGEDFMRPRISSRPSPSEERRSQRSGMDRKEIEELAEVIVDEKLRDIRGEMKSADARFTQFNSRLETLSAEIDKIRSEKSGEVKGIEQKIDNYSTHIDEMNGRIESMEKALKDSLSPMLESMRSLSELVKNMKEKKE